MFFITKNIEYIFINVHKNGGYKTMNKKEKLIRADLTEEINEVESALADSYNNLQSVTEEGLIDYYSYRIKAYEAKHKYLLDIIKEL